MWKGNVLDVLNSYSMVILGCMIISLAVLEENGEVFGFGGGGMRKL